jgi:hypothetical protein
MPGFGDMHGRPARGQQPRLGFEGPAGVYGTDDELHGRTERRRRRQLPAAERGYQHDYHDPRYRQI